MLVFPSIRTASDAPQVVDLVGVKNYVIEQVTPLTLAHGIRFTGAHPMAGLARAGYERSFADLFQGARMILVPTAATAWGDVDALHMLFMQVGFRQIKVCDPKTHDRMIAHTSQLAHVVSNCYVKSPFSVDYVGFAGGSYKDMTHIACLNENVWTELFLLNRDALVQEVDHLLHNITAVRDALAAGDAEQLRLLLREGAGGQGAHRRAQPRPAIR